MSIKDMLAAGPPERRYSDKIGQWRTTLDDETRKMFDAAVLDPAWTHVALADMLTESGFRVSDKTVKRYRDSIVRAEG